MTFTEGGATSADREDRMHHRQITLGDGRYLIFYTFGSSPNVQAEADRGSQAEPQGQPDSPEEPLPNRGQLMVI